ncbi:hypothetical protein [Nocardia bhagyanarayanae]|uniref:Uncharacterized protein n=1 Tax=Nocardia bhagyanarayanae TaxID=1215925 RepID=A0A543F409_9NOCA|nr:hypothetical protein [Nocardia bhagyanarayanae]TQM28556.1 hypothetical protein FB390_0129 [Nocardia bhagyanarayanae]
MSAIYHTSDWPRDSARLADRLVAELPSELRLDFTGASLERLEAELLRRFSDPAELTSAEARPFYESVCAYFGEVMVRYGGSWGWSTKWDDTDPPVVMPDEDVDLEPLSTWEVVIRAVRDRGGKEFITVWELWDDAETDQIDRAIEEAEDAEWDRDIEEWESED